MPPPCDERVNEVHAPPTMRSARHKRLIYGAVFPLLTIALVILRRDVATCCKKSVRVRIGEGAKS
ncbi:MAG: hypothetical protein KDA72_17170, partial [Planctomycetales bacterium]|nr:hypothetical protein [Planctomycetales bacterium]